MFVKLANKSSVLLFYSGPCPAAYWTYSDWSACSATCGGGVATRQATCTSSDGSQCTDPQEPTSTPCNTAACHSYSWLVSQWGDCNAQCGGGNRTRTVQCVDSQGAPADDSMCTAQKFSTTEPCNIQACDFCADNPCLGRGQCLNGACQCSNGYSGDKCEIPPGCSSGIIDANLQCCDSGLVNVRGECCPQGSRVDADGECCDKTIDVCGQCGGNGLFIDMQGTCCTVADANGVCCHSGMVDECGVCDGVGNSCNVTLSTAVDVPASLLMGGAVQDVPITNYFQGAAASMGLDPASVSLGTVSAAVPPSPPSAPAGRRLAQDAPSTASNSTATVPLVVDVTIAPPANGTTATSSTPFSAAYLAAQLPAAAANQSSASGIAIVGSPAPGRTAICGNGICEIGERTTVGAQEGSCPQDCGLPAQACIGGCGIGGNCMPSSGVCQCYLGYLGPNCVQCAQGYIMSGGVCVTSVSAWGIINASLINAQGQATVTGLPDDATGHSGPSVGVIVGAVIGGVVGFALLIGLVWFFCRSRGGRSPFSGKHDQFMTPNAAFEAGDEELGLRHKYGVAGPQVGPGPASARAYQVHVAAGAAVDGEGFHSAREHQNAAYDPFQMQQRPSQSAHYEGSGPMGDFARRSTHSLPAYAEMQGSGRLWDPSSRPNSGRLNSSRPTSRPGSARQVDPMRSSRTGSLGAGPMAPRPPSARDDVRASRTSLGLSASGGATTSDSHSAAVSLGAAGDEVRSSTTSALDPGARLFFNPAFSVEDPPKSMAAAAAAARRMPMSARLADGGSGAGSARGRPTSARSGAGASAEEVEDRRAKLQALRAAVRAMEKQRGVGPAGVGAQQGQAEGASGSGQEQQLGKVR